MFPAVALTGAAEIDGFAVLGIEHVMEKQPDFGSCHHLLLGEFHALLRSLGRKTGMFGWLGGDVTCFGVFCGLVFVLLAALFPILLLILIATTARLLITDS